MDVNKSNWRNYIIFYSYNSKWFYLIILFEFMILKKISIFHLVHFIIVFKLFYTYSNGIDFDDHGYYNIKYFFVIVIFFIIFINFFKFIFSFKRKKILFFSLILFIYAFENIIYNFINCKDWEIGLNNTSINNDMNKYECLIQIPKLLLIEDIFLKIILIWII